MAIARSALLEILLRAAQDVGVEIEMGCDRRLDEVRDADLVIAADGVGSAVREQFSGRLGARLRLGNGVFIWLGVDKALTANLFAPVFTDHGMFNIHGYPYTSDRSTIGVEADFETFQAAGMDVSTDQTSPDRSDQFSVDYLQRAFAEVLDNAQILANRSRWMRFRTVTLDRWHIENIVLIGDAAHTAHYSLGSGTKLALEDALALASTVSRGEVSEALTEYERLRRPPVESLQDRAIRSQRWWESLRHRVDAVDASQMMLAYLSRAGAVSGRVLAKHDPALLREGLASFAGVGPDDVDINDPSRWTLARAWSRGDWRAQSRVIGDSVLGLPSGLRRLTFNEALNGASTLDHTQDGGSYLEVTSLHELVEARKKRPHGRACVVLSTRIDDPWAEQADALHAHCLELQEAGAAAIRLEGPTDRRALLDRVALAERIKLQTSLVVIVTGPRAFIDDLADGVAAGRADLVAVFSDSESDDGY